jgi:hypothetical protein
MYHGYDRFFVQVKDFIVLLHCLLGNRCLNELLTMKQESRSTLVRVFCSADWDGRLRSLTALNDLGGLQLGLPHPFLAAACCVIRLSSTFSDRLCVFFAKQVWFQLLPKVGLRDCYIIT